MKEGDSNPETLRASVREILPDFGPVFSLKTSNRAAENLFAFGSARLQTRRRRSRSWYPRVYNIC